MWEAWASRPVGAGGRELRVRGLQTQYELVRPGLGSRRLVATLSRIFCQGTRLSGHAPFTRFLLAGTPYVLGGPELKRMGRQSQLQVCPDLILKWCQPFVFKANTSNCFQGAGETLALVLDPGGSGLESQTLSPLSSFTKPLQLPLSHGWSSRSIQN